MFREGYNREFKEIDLPVLPVPKKRGIAIPV
jgi:hypothetical protein